MDLYQMTEFDRHVYKLAALLDFEEADLEYNRAGTLSPAQIARLEARIRTEYWVVIAVLCAVAFVTGMLGALSGAAGWGWFAPCGVVMGAALWAAWRLRRDRERLPEREVGVTTIRMGRVGLLLRRLGSDEGKATFKIGDNRQLYANRQLYRIMRPNREYDAYFVQLSSLWPRLRIVSMEPVGAWIEDDAPASKRKAPPEKRSRFRLRSH